MRRIVHVRTLDGYRLDLGFDDGISGIVDVSHLAGRGVFGLWNDSANFHKVAIGSSGELVWGDQADLCPDALHNQLNDSFKAYV